MICHLAVFHPPDLLQIRVLTDNPEDPNWAWLKWLPHVQHQTDTDAAGATRLVFTRPDGLSDLTARGPHTADSAPSGPYVVVIDLTGGRAGFPVDGRAGVTVITLGNHRGSAYRIRVDADGSADDRLPNQTFRLVTTAADRMTPAQATRVARKLAGWSITGTIIDKSVRVQKKVATEWHQLVGAQTVEEVTPSRWRMFTDTDRDRLRIPFGHELKTGDIMHLDIKEGAEFGAGPHGMLIGTTGSGKSEFLRTLILSLAATHHPDQVNLLLTDFKGGSTFLGMEKLPHTAAVVTNMEEEAELVSRMGEVLTGELDRRQSILRQAGMQVGAAGALSGVAEYEKHRERGADLPPLPTLFVVVDEFAELLQNHPDFIGLFDRICRVGRSLRVHLLLATQSLNTGGVRIDKLEPNLTYRIALRTTSSAESKAVIGTPEAQYITNKESGVGFLRVGMEDPVKFHSVYTGVNYVPSRRAIRTTARSSPRTHGAESSCGSASSRRPRSIDATAVTSSMTTCRIRTACAARGRPRPADHRRDPRVPNVVAAVDRSDAGQRTRRARPPAAAAAVRPGNHGRAASAPPGSLGHRRVGGRRQHRRRRRPADRQVDVPADAGAVGRGHAHPEAGSVLLRRPRRRRPDVPRGPAARRRRRDPFRTRPGQPRRRRNESRSAPT